MMRAVHTPTFDRKSWPMACDAKKRGPKFVHPSFVCAVAFLFIGRATRRVRSVSRRLRSFEDDLNIGRLPGVDGLVRIRE